VLFAVFVTIYLYVTPYDEIALIRSNNAAAAISLSGALLGFAMPIANVIAHSDTLLDLAVWGVVAGVVQLLAWMLARVALPNLQEDIAAGRTAPATFVAALSVTIGLLNAASMTY
jgi:putative membrane protein